MNKDLLKVSLIAVLSLTFVGFTYSQTPSPSPTPEARSDAKPEETPKASQTAGKADPNKPMTAEQVAETSLFIYGLGGGRQTLDRIRKTTIERGKMVLTSADGKVDQVNYVRSIIRGTSLGDEKIRLDEELSSARFALIFEDAKVYGVYNNTVFTPRADASSSFENSIVHGIEAYLRYKENGSTLALVGKEKDMGVDFNIVEVTDKAGHKTKFYISAKTFRVMMLTYEEGGIKYKRKFYNQNYTQGTLVAYRTVLFTDDKTVEESEINSISFGQKVDDGLFSLN